MENQTIERECFRSGTAGIVAAILFHNLFPNDSTDSRVCWFCRYEQITPLPFIGFRQALVLLSERPHVEHAQAFLLRPCHVRVDDRALARPVYAVNDDELPPTFCHGDIVPCTEPGYRL